MNINKNPQSTYLENLYDFAREHKLPHAVIIECFDNAEAYNTALKIVTIALCTGKEDKPCKKCGNCVKMNNNSHPDVKTIYPQGTSKSIRIDNIRFIRGDAYIVSNEGSYKFYIITDADYMTVQAQNALIKILEEPPKNVIFIILCKSSLSLLETVRSRSQIFEIRPEVIKETGAETENLADKITKASLSADKCEVMRLIASIPNDRIFLKSLTQGIISSFIKIYSYKNDFDIGYENLMEIISELKYTASLADKNINFNLLTCYLCACLQN